MRERFSIRKKSVRIFLSFFVLGIVTACQESLSPQHDRSKGKPEVEEVFSLGGAPVQVKVGLSQEKVALTDRLTVTIRIEYTEDVRIVPPYLSEAVYAPLLLVEKPQNEVRWSQDNRFLIDEWRYVFEPTGSGEFALNAFQVFFRLNGERTPDISDWPVYTIHIDSIPYQVVGVELDPAHDIKEIKGFILPPYDTIPVIVTVGSLLLLGILLSAFFLYYSKIAKGRVAKVAPVDYCRQALEELESLDQKDLIGKQAFAQLHTELSAILRRYLENHFKIKAQEQTTDEFIVEISESKRFSGELRNMLQQFLRLADLVKFATYEPKADISRGAVEDIRAFVLKTGRPHGI